jgi:hypothetical protein
MTVTFYILIVEKNALKKSCREKGGTIFTYYAYISELAWFLDN